VPGDPWASNYGCSFQLCTGVKPGFLMLAEFRCRWAIAGQISGLGLPKTVFNGIMLRQSRDAGMDDN
jgi:hypothetical protein